MSIVFVNPPKENIWIQYSQDENLIVITRKVDGKHFREKTFRLGQFFRELDISDNPQYCDGLEQQITEDVRVQGNAKKLQFAFDNKLKVNLRLDRNTFSSNCTVVLPNNYGDVHYKDGKGVEVSIPIRQLSNVEVVKMGVDYSIKIWGLRSPDEKHKRMVAVLEACQEADTELPVSIAKYFNCEVDEFDDVMPSRGLRQEIPTETVAPKEMEEFIESAYAIDPAKIPNSVEKILVELHASC